MGVDTDTAARGRAAASPAIGVVLSGALVDLFPGAERRLEVAATNVNELVDALDRRWPGMADRIRDSRPAIRRHMNVFVDGKRAALDTALRPGVRVYILTAISGG